MTREEAIELGSALYQASKPCKRGHYNRYTKNQGCPDCTKVWNKNFKQANPEYAKQWSQNTDRSAYYKEWAANNPDKVRIKSANRRARELQAAALWTNWQKIYEIYRDCPDGYEVDHIIPLQGKLVSGLHVENNLQYLTISENRKKKNHYNGH